MVTLYSSIFFLFCFHLVCLNLALGMFEASVVLRWGLVGWLFLLYSDGVLVGDHAG